VRAYELLKESDFQLFWCGESNYQIIFTFGWVEDLQTIKNSKCFSYFNHDFCHCCKVLVSGEWEHMNYWKRVISNCFDVVSPFIKSFLLLVEWEIFLTIINKCFSHLNHDCKVTWKLVSGEWEHMNYFCKKINLNKAKRMILKKKWCDDKSMALTFSSEAVLSCCGA